MESLHHSSLQGGAETGFSTAPMGTRASFLSREQGTGHLNYYFGENDICIMFRTTDFDSHVLWQRRG